jgi:acyl-coenzyme A thioesterase PaaI-like protein
MPWSDAPADDAPACRGPHDVVLPAGSAIDPVALYAVATTTNAAHAALGTELLGVFADGASLRLPWRPELADADDGRAWGPGVVAELLDHVCSLAALVALGSAERFGATMSLRVEHGAEPLTGPTLVAHARGVVDGMLVRVDGVVRAAAGSPAHGRCTVSVAP